MANFIPLNAADHAKLRWQPRPDYGFAAAQLLCPVLSAEIRVLACHYGIVFVGEDQPQPQVLLGLQQGCNAYLAGSGGWRCPVLPAWISRYPFQVAPVQRRDDADPEEAQSYAVLVDASAPQLSEQQGMPLFNDDGSPSDTFARIRQALLLQQRDQQATLAMACQLEEAGLLVSRELPIRTGAGAGTTLTGLKLIDTDRFLSLEPETLGKLQRSGALQLAYAHLISLSNLAHTFLLHGESTSGGLSAATLHPLPQPGADPLTGETFGF